MKSAEGLNAMLKPLTNRYEVMLTDKYILFDNTLNEIAYFTKDYKKMENVISGFVLGRETLG